MKYHYCCQIILSCIDGEEAEPKKNKVVLEFAFLKRLPDEKLVQRIFEMIALKS